MKKAICVILSIVTVISLAACGKNQSGGKNQNGGKSAVSDQTLTLLYSATDGVNPYTAKTESNRRLCSLLFDPLVKVGEDYTTEMFLAENCTAEGNTVSVTLKSLNFSDGTAVTAADVAYSFSLAKASVTSGYASTLATVQSAEARDGKTVVFTLTRNDPYAANLLTFPIIKEGTSGRKDSDGVEYAPVGCGRYTENGGEFVRNDNYYGKKGAVKTIKLLSSPDGDSASHYVEVGATDLYFTDVSGGSITRMSGSRSEIDLNRLVYIGVNSSYGALSKREMRYAISSAIDRSQIVTSAYYGAATAANGFMNPAFSDAAATGSLKAAADTQISIENLEKLGYNKKDEDGYAVTESGYRAAFSLLVNSDNVSRLSAARLIVTQCKAAGIQITVEEEPFDKYSARLSSGQFQLYLGETQMLPDMDVGGLTVPGGSAAYGVTETPAEGSSMTVSSATAAFYSGQINISALSGVLITEMPQIPVCYRKGLIFYSDKIKSGVKGLYCDIYYSIADYNF